MWGPTANSNPAATSNIFALRGGLIRERGSCGESRAVFGAEERGFCEGRDDC